MAKNYKTTKLDRIKSHLLSGQSITPIQALRQYGSFSLGAIVRELRKRGFDIKTELVKYPPTGSRFAKYSMTKPDENETR